ncbi:hypothetical protein ABH922_000235 [Rhodococcus sp. 27YEA15]|uniref:hypothetical protein n=1 Tax=Rhodococcus sp. 27YEA15 TaxID=3156259 RepID=UPI003C7AAC83
MTRKNVVMDLRELVGVRAEANAPGCVLFHRDSGTGRVNGGRTQQSASWWSGSVADVTRASG